VPAYRGCPAKKAAKCVCVCVCVKITAEWQKAAKCTCGVCGRGVGNNMTFTSSEVSTHELKWYKG